VSGAAVTVIGSDYHLGCPGQLDGEPGSGTDNVALANHAASNGVAGFVWASLI